MSVFSNTDELITVMVELWNRIKADPGMADKLLKSRLVVRFIYRDPEGCLTIDCSDGQEIKVIPHDRDVKPVVEMTMNADVAHKFWLGQENLAIAVLRGRIVSRGSVNKVLALVPVVRPAFSDYPRIMERIKGAAGSCLSTD